MENKFTKNLIFVLTYLAIFVLCLSPIVVTAGTLVTLPNIPQAITGNDFTPYVEGWVTLLIGLGAVLAVIMIVLAGVEYMSTDAVFNKSEAKSKIAKALGGLALLIMSWLILNTINPNLLNFNLNLTNLPATSGTPAPAQWCFTYIDIKAQNYTFGGAYVNPTAGQRTSCASSQSSCDSLKTKTETAQISAYNPVGNCYQDLSDSTYSTYCYDYTTNDGTNVSDRYCASGSTYTACMALRNARAALTINAYSNIGNCIQK